MARRDGIAMVAIGGGHGTAATLRAARCYAATTTAIVSVADDGGSSGRLRELLDMVALGDVRNCLVALAAPGSVLARAFAHRFEEGELAGHALGNLVLAGLVDATGDLVAGIAEAAALLKATGEVFPATTEPVVLKAEGDGWEVAGQVAVAATEKIHRVSLVPEDAAPPEAALAAIARADQVVIGPGSLYTSVLAAAAVPAIVDALAATSAQMVFVCNMRPQSPETTDYSVADHVAALRTHGIEVDVVLCDTSAGMPMGDFSGRRADRPLAGASKLVHDPLRLAEALAGLME